MRRRDFIAGAIGVSLSAMLKPGHAAQMVLGPTMPSGTPRRAWVAQPAIIRQSCPLWCWAASASMIFPSHQHALDQAKIVARVFQTLVCAAAPATLTMAQVLSSAWVDDFGQPFRSQILAAYDPANGIYAINNGIIAQELSQDRPLLYANLQHAMVVAQVDFFDTPYGPDVRSVGVFDPWPYNPAFHPLSGPEMVPVHLGGQMTFLAAVQVS